MNDDARVVFTLGQVWSDWQQRFLFPFPPNHCIAGTRIAVEVLKAFDIEAVPTPVDLVLYQHNGNEELIACVLSDPNLRDEIQGGSDIVLDKLGADVEPCHVVAYIPSMRWTLDMSVGQFREDDFFALPNVLHMQDCDLRSDQWAEVTLPDGASLNLRESTTTDPLWRRRYKALDVEDIIDAVLDELLEHLVTH